MKYYALFALALIGFSSVTSAAIYPANQGLELEIIPPNYHKNTVLSYKLTGSKAPLVTNKSQEWLYAAREDARIWWPMLNNNGLTYTARGSSIANFIHVEVRFELNGVNYVMKSNASAHSKKLDTNNDGAVNGQDGDFAPALVETGHAKTLALNFDENSTSNVHDFNDFYTKKDDDRDGDSINYSLSGADASQFSIDTQGRLTFNSAPDYESGKHQYHVTVSAKNHSNILHQDLSDAVDVTININNKNDNPTVGTVHVTPAGPVAAGRALTVSANIQDADGPAHITPTFKWQRKAGGTWVNIAHATHANYSTTLDDEAKQVRALAIYVDGSGATIEKASNAVSVTTAFGPQISGKTLTVPENTAAIFYNINDINTGNDIDKDGIAIRYALEGADKNSFSIGAATGSLQFKAPGADYEVKNQYAFVVAATSGLKTVRAPFTVTISNLDDNNPTGAFSISPTGTVPRNQVLSISQSITDKDGIASPIVYKWQRAVAGSWVTINGQIALTYTTQLADEGKQIRALATYTDGAGASEQVISNSVSVAVDGAPVLDNQNLTVNENQPFSVDINDKNTGVDNDSNGDAIRYSLAGADSHSFTLNANTGELRLKQPADFEAKSSYSVVVTATANGKSAHANINLNVTNVNEAYTGSVSILPQGVVSAGTELTASNNLTDLDGPSPLVVTYQWQRQEAGVWQDIAGANNARYQTQNADVNKQLQVVASFTDAFGDSVKVSSTVAVNVNPAAAAPVAPAPTAPSSTADIKTGIQGVGSMHLWGLLLLGLVGFVRRK